MRGRGRARRDRRLSDTADPAVTGRRDAEIAAGGPGNGYSGAGHLRPEPGLATGETGFSLGAAIGFTGFKEGLATGFNLGTKRSGKGAKTCQN
jgi:hypothetical protein